MKSYLIFLLLPLVACWGKMETKSMDELDAEYEREQSTTLCSNESSASLQSDSRLPQSASFPSLDGLEVTAKVYPGNADAPILLLCHQARYNKSEYDGIAERLQRMGFNCIAIDQRSGGPIGAAQNETYNRAISKGLSTNYLDAEQDLRAAVLFAKTRFDAPLYLWGSSYSSTLALYLGAELSDIEGVIAFSPGDYLADAKGSLKPIMQSYTKPYFITSSDGESTELKRLLPVERTENQMLFDPIGAGHHGSRALWINQAGGKEYWTALEQFLELIYPSLTK